MKWLEGYCVFSNWVLLTINYDLDKIQKYKRLNSQKISQEIWWAIPQFAGSQDKKDAMDDLEITLRFL